MYNGPYEFEEDSSSATSEDVVSIPKELLRYIVYFEQLWKTVAVVVSQHSEETLQLSNNVINQLLRTTTTSATIDQYLDALLTYPEEALEAYKSSLTPAKESKVITTDS